MQLSPVRRRFGIGLAAAVVASFLTTGALAAPAPAAPAAPDPRPRPTADTAGGT